MGATNGTGRKSRSLAECRAELVERLRERWGEIEREAMARLYGVAEPSSSLAPEYLQGLRVAASAALEYLLDGAGRGEARSLRPPAATLVQARLAARNGISLDTVLRRCFAGYTLFGDFLMQEAEDLLTGAGVKCLLRDQAALFDRLLVAVTEEYARESRNRPASTGERRAELVRRLLAGEPLDSSELSYDLDAHHLGAIANGPGAGQALRELAASLDRRLLALGREEGTVWAWLGARQAVDLEQLKHLASGWPAHLSLAIGEPSVGRGGWRLTHRQAKAALPIALRSPKSFVRYADVALLASILRDDLLATSLRETYLRPLARERGEGEALRETLRAYFATGRNSASAAATLGITRQTVNNRLRAVEQRLERPLAVCAAELEVALRLNELEEAPRSGS